VFLWDDAILSEQLIGVEAGIRAWLPSVATSLPFVALHLKDTLMKTRCILALMVTILASTASNGGEIDIHYTNLNGTLTLTAVQNGNSVGDPTCTTTMCSLYIEGLPAVDFPPQYLYAGVEIEDPGFVNPRTFSDLVYYTASAPYLNGMPLDPCEGNLAQCSADVQLEFFAYPFDFPLLGNTPTFLQPYADGMEHELTSLFEDPRINFPNTVVGLPAAAIHVFVTSDGANVVPEPATALMGICLAGCAIMSPLMRKRKAKKSGEKAA
jgi:hypothetical protein